MSVLDDNIRQRFDRMHEKMAQDVTRTFDLIDKIKSGDVTGIELDEKSMRIPFKTFPADRISDDRTVEDRIHNAEVAMREKCAKLASTPESTNEEVMRIARYDPTSWDGRRCRLQPGVRGHCKENHGVEMNHDITQQSIYVPTAEENEAFEHGYAAGKLAGERAERERCARISEGEIFGCNGDPAGDISERIRRAR